MENLRYSKTKQNTEKTVLKVPDKVVNILFAVALPLVAGLSRNAFAQGPANSARKMPISAIQVTVSPEDRILEILDKIAGKLNIAFNQQAREKFACAVTGKTTVADKKPGTYSPNPFGEQPTEGEGRGYTFYLKDAKTAGKFGAALEKAFKDLEYVIVTVDGNEVTVKNTNPSETRDLGDATKDEPIVAENVNR